jgi:hypothetical protein
MYTKKRLLGRSSLKKIKSNIENGRNLKFESKCGLDCISCKFCVSSSSKRQRFRSAHSHRSFPPNFLPEISSFSCFPKSLSSTSVVLIKFTQKKKNRPRGEEKTRRKVDDGGGGGCGSEARRFRNLFYWLPNSAMSNENDGYASSSISNHFITAV